MKCTRYFFWPWFLIIFVPIPSLWLNEGFARYMQYVALDRVLNSTTGIKDRFVPEVEMKAMAMGKLLFRPGNPELVF